MTLSLALITPSFYPMIGGIENYTREIGKQLTTLGIDVHVYTADSVLGRRVEPSEELLDGIHVHRIPVSFDLSYRIKFWPGLYSALMRERHDILHVYSHDTYALMAGMAARKNSTPLVVTTYGPFVNHSDYGLAKALLLSLYDDIITPRLLRSSSLVCVRYPELLQWVNSFGLKSRVHVEPSGLPASYMREGDGRRLREEYSLDGPLLLYLGRISPQKGLSYLLLAFRKVLNEFEDVKMLLVGPDYTGYSSSLKELATEYKISQNLLFLPPVMEESSEIDIIASCDIFVMPSSFEGFSQAVIKALAQGKPAVVTDVGGLPYEVDYGRCGLVTRYGDYSSLASSLIRLLKDDSLRTNLGEAGRIRAREFTFDKLAKKLAEEYKKLV